MKRDRLRPVRLGDIPLPVRLAAARREGHHVDEDGRVALLAAAICPSRQVYWVRADVAEAA